MLVLNPYLRILAWFAHENQLNTVSDELNNSNKIANMYEQMLLKFSTFITLSLILPQNIELLVQVNTKEWTLKSSRISWSQYYAR